MLKFSPLFWIVIGLVITALEMVVPGFVIIWFGVAGLVTGILAFFIRSPLAQVLIFCGLSAILVTTSQLIARRITKPEPEPVGANRLIGIEGLVIRPIEPPNIGRVKVLGEEWRAEAQTSLAAGDRVRVEKVDGTRLVVTPVEERSQ